MMLIHCLVIILTVYTCTVAAGKIRGYHYEKPRSTLGSAHLAHGHSFAPIPTLRPLPPVPALPPLPTARPKGQFIQTQTIFQTHPAISGSGKIAQQYQPPSLQATLLAQQSIASSAKSAPTGTAFSSLSAPSITLASNIANPSAPPVQPLRVPFGKEAVISFPSGASNSADFDPNGRQLHQYAVIEIIDNDIEQSTQPFLNSVFFDSYRAHAAGVTPPPLGSRLLGGRSSNAFLGQTRSLSQLPTSDAVALGSGGLGFIRLANGNIYLGSGSLGYVSGQQHSQELNEARTRSGAHQPDALHFGHGPLGNPARFNRFSSTFNK